MRILLTGGTGFIGKAIGIALVKEGHEIVLVSRNPENIKVAYACEPCPWTAEDISNIDAVIHLAGESIAAKRWTAKQKEILLSSRIESTKNLFSLLEKIKGRKPQVLLAATAIGYYGNRGDEELNESSIKGVGFLSEICDAWEREIFKAPKMRLVLLRMGLVLGRNGGVLEKILPLFRMNLGGRLGNGQQWLSWIHLQDVVGLFLFGLKNTNAQGVINAIAPQPVQNSSFTKILAEKLHRWRAIPAPAFLLKALLGEMSTLLLDGQKIKPKRALELGYVFQYQTLPDALDNLLR